MSRRSAEQTRTLLIDTAMSMLHKQGAAAGVTHIKLSDVVVRAGLTTGAAYRLWNDQQAFHNELATAAVGWRDPLSTSPTVAGITSVLQIGGPLREVIRLSAEANLQTFPKDIAFLATLALRASAWGNPALVAASRKRHLDAMRAYGEVYAGVMKFYHRRMRQPFTLDHLCSALAALAEGFGVQAACGEPHPRIGLAGAGGDSQDWTLLGVAAAAVMDHLTEVIPDATPADVGKCNGEIGRLRPPDK